MAREIIDQCEYCVVYSDGTIKISQVRFSYPHLDEPWAKKPDEKKKFSLVGLLPFSTHKPAALLVKKRIDLILVENKQDPKIFKKDARFLRNGNDAGKAEYLDHYTINASEDRQPSLRDAQARTVTPQKAKGLFLPGHWGAMLIRPWWQNNEHGKRVNAGLVAAQWQREDEVFGEGFISEDDIDETFDAVDDDSGFEDDDEL